MPDRPTAVDLFASGDAGPGAASWPSERAVVAPDEAAMARKVAALGHYRPQASRPYSEAFLRRLCVVHGVQAGAPFAEAVETVILS